MDGSLRTFLAQWLTALQDAQRHFSFERLEETAIPSYAHKNPAIRWLFRQRLAEVQKILGSPNQPQGVRVLDFGCGSGFGASLLRHSGYDVAAYDIDPTFFHWFGNRYPQLLEGIELYRSLADIPTGAFDAIIAADVLEHLDADNLERHIRWLKTRLSGGSGKLIVSGPSETLLYKIGRRLAGFHGHYHERSIYQIAEAIEKDGWIRVRTRRIPLPILCEAFLIILFQLDDRKTRTSGSAH
jgi:2-polyprenyl-3-methyl-5-hydroxy-6-metoxy-1,4-benzoquinol methylase